MNRLLILFSLALMLAVCAAPQATAANARPNVLLICVDDLKPTIGAYGDRLAKTPALDRLATRSVLFENTYCNQAVCAASRNNLLVGSRSTTLGIYNLATNFRRAVPDAVTLPAAAVAVVRVRRRAAAVLAADAVERLRLLRVRCCPRTAESPQR